MEQECADIPVQLYLEYQKEYGEDPTITLASGEVIKWSEWKSHPRSKEFGVDWRGFQRYAFTYIGAETLKRTLNEVTVEDLQPGDLILVKYGPGNLMHTETIKNIEEEDGIRYFTVFGGSSPPIDPYIYPRKSESSLQELVKDNIYFLRRF